MLKFFFYGILASLGALFLEMTISVTSWDAISINIASYQISWALILAVLIEESLKLLFINKYIQEIKNNKINGSVILNSEKIFFGSILFGFGFSVLESFFFIYDPSITASASYLNILGVIMIHAATSGYIGYFLSFEWIAGLLVSIRIIMIASLFHFLYNLLVIYDAADHAKIIYLSVVIFFLILLKYNRNWIEKVTDK